MVEVFGEAWADHDLEGALAMLTEDCVFDSKGFTAGGRDEGATAHLDASAKHRSGRR